MDGVRCMVMRGGTSKGLYFVADELPADAGERDDLLLRIMGSPDDRQIDGLGGAHPLTSKVAIVGPSDRDDADVDYLFLQLGVGEATVSDRQNCGNLLAGVGPFALARGLVSAAHVTNDTNDTNLTGAAAVRIHMINTDSLVVAIFPVEDGRLCERGDTSIDGVPGTAAAVRLDFDDIAGGSCGALLPTGRVVDTIDGIDVTLIDNGMPVVVMLATDIGVTGTETPAELENDGALRERLESIRLQAGPMMHLGDVAETTVPKMTIVSPPTAGGDVSTRTFIPHRCHEAIGVFGAVSVATAVLLPGSPGATVLRCGAGGDGTITCEHPTGTFTAALELDADAGTRDGDSPPVSVRRAGIIRTARPLMDGLAFPRPPAAP